MSDQLKCTKCGVVKPVEEFHKNRSTGPKRLGRGCWCRICQTTSNIAWRASHREYLQSYMKKLWREPGEIGDRRRERARQQSRESYVKAREIIRARYGYACQCCGETEKELLTLDHIDGKGGEHRRAIKRGGVQMYLWIIRQGLPDGYRTLCFNCNSARGAYGYCPRDRVDPFALVGACG